MLTSATSDVDRRFRNALVHFDPLLLLYASWYLSGHDAYLLDDGQSLFELFARNDLPLSAEEWTLVQAGLRADVNKDARWQGRRVFEL